MTESYEKLPGCIDVSTASEILGLSEATVRKYIKCGDIPCIRIGKQIRIPKDSFTNYLHHNNI